MNTVEFDLPVYWASYLVNGDDSGLEPGELEAINAFLEKEGLTAGQCADVSEEQWFAHSNDTNSVGGDVATYTFLCPPVVTIHDPRFPPMPHLGNLP